MRPGILFRAVNDQNRVLALLVNEGATVCDTARVWCVVVAASPLSGVAIGSTMQLPFDALVQPLHVEQPMQLSAVA